MILSFFSPLLNIKSLFSFNIFIIWSKEKIYLNSSTHFLLTIKNSSVFIVGVKVIFLLISFLIFSLILKYSKIISR